jgi:hypothetical protein
MCGLLKKHSTELQPHQHVELQDHLVQQQKRVKCYFVKPHWKTLCFCGLSLVPINSRVGLPLKHGLHIKDHVTVNVLVVANWYHIIIITKLTHCGYLCLGCNSFKSCKGTQDNKQKSKNKKECKSKQIVTKLSK